MMRKPRFFGVVRAVLLAGVTSFLFQVCSEEAILPAQEATPAVTEEAALAVAPPPAVCSTCTYVVPAGAWTIDGQKLGFKPGAVICLSASIQYGQLIFVNINGTAAQPITITNCGGTANVVAKASSGYGVLTQKSKYFRITGGTSGYGIVIRGGTMGLKLDGLSTNFEVDHVDVGNTGFAGIMAKTDPSCDAATWRANFTMRDVSIHDNYVHDTAGEGMYIGNSFYQNGMSTSCGVKLPHAIVGIKIFNNLVKNAGWDGIQLSCAISGAAIYGNTIEGYGKTNTTYQQSGIQLGEGTGGLLYNNFIKDGTGVGLHILGLGDNVIHDNIIVNAGAMGIFCDERLTPGPGFKFINNTIINPKGDGIRLYAELVPMNVLINNIIVNPGTGQYVVLLNKALRVDMTNNYYTKNIADVKFIGSTTSNYRLNAVSPAVNKGRDVSTFGIAVDYYKHVRKSGTAVDIGASEY